MSEDMDSRLCGVGGVHLLTSQRIQEHGTKQVPFKRDFNGQIAGSIEFPMAEGWEILEQIELLNSFQSHICENYLFGTLC